MTNKHKFSTIIFLVTLFSGSVFSKPLLRSMEAGSNWGMKPKSSIEPAPLVKTSTSKLPLLFIANQGQMNRRVAYYVMGSDKTLYFTSEGITFSLPYLSSYIPSPGGKGKLGDKVCLKSKKCHDKRSDRSDYYDGETPRFAQSDDPVFEQFHWHAPGKTELGKIKRWNIKLDFVGANKVQPAGLEKTTGIVSYFKGQPNDWHTNLPTYSKITYRDLWQGIDLTYNGTTDWLKYEFLLHPGADPDSILLGYRGAEVILNVAGQLEVKTPYGSFTDDIPTAYQEVNGQRVSVAVSYALHSDGSYGFQLGAYDPGLPLVIDPAVLVYCGFIGGDDSDSAYSVAVDSAGNAYVVGETASSEMTFPVTEGPDISYNGGALDAFIVKIAADGSELVYAGFIGGDDSDLANGVAVDTEGNAYIVGQTQSTEASFPVITGPDLNYNGGYKDAFIAKVNSAGDGLDFLGFVGGDSIEEGLSIAVDSSGCSYITGYTYSTEATFPVIIGPDLSFNGGMYGDAFVAKIKADGTGLVYAGYIGGDDSEWGYGIAVDTSNSAYVTGVTKSTEDTFPIVVGPDLSHNGEEDSFVAKVKADGTGLIYSGYIGGFNNDAGYSIDVDTGGNAYIIGSTLSSEISFPVVGGPDLTYNGGSRDVYVAKVKPDGSRLLYAGYIGGNDWDLGYGIAVDSESNVYITGYSFSTETTFPVINGPDLTHNGGYWDAFVAKVNSVSASLIYCGYIGGDDTDIGQGIAVDTAGNAYVAGKTDSLASTFPEMIGPDLTQNGDRDAFIAKISAVEAEKYQVYLPNIIR